MKLFIILLFAFVAQIYAGTSIYSSEEDYRQSNDNNNAQKIHARNYARNQAERHAEVLMNSSEEDQVQSHNINTQNSSRGIHNNAQKTHVGNRVRNQAKHHAEVSLNSSEEDDRPSRTNSFKNSSKNVHNNSRKTYAGNQAANSAASMNSSEEDVRQSRKYNTKNSSKNIGNQAGATMNSSEEDYRESRNYNTPNTNSRAKKSHAGYKVKQSAEASMNSSEENGSTANAHNNAKMIDASIPAEQSAEALMNSSEEGDRQYRNYNNPNTRKNAKKVQAAKRTENQAEQSAEAYMNSSEDASIDAYSNGQNIHGEHYAEIFMDSSEEKHRQPHNNNNTPNSSETYTKWQSSASSLPEAKAYKTKVTHRIQNSSSLSSMPNLKERLYQLADEKLEKCLKPNGQQLDKHCVGSMTGLVMQLISAVENSSRNTAYV